MLLTGASAFFLASKAFQADSLAFSRPGLTVLEPLVASLLEVILFGERRAHHALILAGEVLVLSPLVASVVLVSRSPLAPTGRCGLRVTKVHRHGRGEGGTR
jgi:drug/metabolite transporter (DMT)-like permease